MARRLVEAGDLALIEGVLGELLGEADEDLFAGLGAAVAKLSDGEHEAGEGGEIVALLGCEFEQANAFCLVGTGTGHAEEPTDGRGLEAEHVVLDADGQVGVVEGGVDGEGLLGVFAGELAVFEGAVLVTVDERGPVGLHAGGDSFAVERVGVIGVALEGCVGEAVGLVDAVVETFFESRVDGGTGAGGEAVVVGEEFDIEDAEELELV